MSQVATGRPAQGNVHCVQLQRSPTILEGTHSNISSNGTAQTNSPPRTESVRVRAGINVALGYPREPGHRAGRICGTAATRQTHYKNKLIKEFRPHSSNSSQTKYLTSTAPEHYSSKYLASTAPSLLEVRLHSHGGGKWRIQLRTQLQHTSGERNTRKNVYALSPNAGLNSGLPLLFTNPHDFRYCSIFCLST